MKLPFATIFAAIAMLCGSAPALAGPQEDYEALREELWQWALDENPGLATRVGDRRGDGKLYDGSLAAYEASVEDARGFLARLDAIDMSTLPEDLQVDYAILHRSLSDQIEAAQFDQDRYIVFSNRYGPHDELASLPYSSPFFSAADYESYLARIEAYPALSEQVIERTRGAIERGLTQPCEPMQGYADGIAALVADDPEQSPLWTPFAQRPAFIAEPRWADLQARARTAITDDANAALREFVDFYRSEYEPECRTGAPGIGQTPGGKAYYDFAVRQFTTTDMSAEEVHQLGLSEVARINAAMEEVVAEAGYDSRAAFLEHLQTAPEYYAETPEELMLQAGALAKHIDGFLPKLFGTLPRLPYTVQPIPAASAPGNTTAYYEPGAAATGQAGIYRVNTTELDQRPYWELPALTVHEAVPGHHLQIALQQEVDIHPLRQFGTFFTAFIEGWGLYSESLGEEMGLYDTPAKEMGRLSYEMWRACRLVVDTGIHAKGWSKQQAVDYMRANTALTDANIDAEVNRYMTWPGQALAYKIGQLKISELRARAEEALGEKFDLRAFHDTVLENGSVPLDVLETHVDRWIAGQQAG